MVLNFGGVLMRCREELGSGDGNLITPSKKDLNSDTYLILDKPNHVIIRLTLRKPSQSHVIYVYLGIV